MAGSGGTRRHARGNGGLRGAYHRAAEAVAAPPCTLMRLNHCKRSYFLWRLTVISGTSAPGVVIDTDWRLPRVIKVMFEVTPIVWATT